ncbi:MAG: hexitol phosphatase HxpB [Sphingobacteriales bacterium]|nr:MAG: hexitol phosphatase HxpB [Sphingobacteriales bacterium]
MSCRIFKDDSIIFAAMKLTTVIFDMDGLLIDSEPFWEEAGKETLEKFNVSLTPEQYASSTGLRTQEWLQHWFHHFNIDAKHIPEAEEVVVQKAIEKIVANGEPMPGVNYILEFFKERNFNIGLATSSPMSLANPVVDKLNIRSYLQTITSAEHLPYGKPHPQVFINCAVELNTTPLQSLVFEDSFNGMIAAKAARMKCVVIPAHHQQEQDKWKAADLQLKSLEEFDERTLQSL